MADPAPPPVPVPAPAKKTPGRLGLAGAVGLGAALALGGVWMMWSSYRVTTEPFDCTGLRNDECALEQDIETAWAKRQFWMGLAFTSLGAVMTLAIWITERRQQSPTAPSAKE